MTAANGAEQYYGLSSDDTIRNETAEQASGIDQQLIEVQESHHPYFVIQLL